MNNIYRKLNDIQFDEVIEEETMTEVEQQQYFNQFKMKNKQKQPSKDEEKNDSNCSSSYVTGWRFTIYES